MNVAIAIFVKTPGLSPLKTRLGATIGREKAEKFYTLSLQTIENTLNTVDVSPYWAVGEVEGLNNPLWQNFDRVHTGDGDLGDRQHHVYRSLLEVHDAVILIGADAPQLSPKILNNALEALNDNEYVIGPASDGGYYLLAGKSDIPASVWAETPWSHDDTRKTLVSKLSSIPHELDMLTDVDTETDLQTVIDEMSVHSADSFNDSQRKLIDWISHL